MLVCSLSLLQIHTMSDHNSDTKAATEESECAGWEGSDVSLAEINWLRKTGCIPDGVICRRPGTELEPEL